LKGRLLAALWLSCLLLSAPAAGTLSAAKYPPGLHWREISRGGFTVIFPAARSLEAEAALTAATGLQGRLADFWRAPSLARTRIVLDDSTDQPNGFATFYPFNLVGLNLAEPPPDSELATSRDWLDLVLAHELTHLFTLNAATDLGRSLRRVFGTLPILYSAAQMPPWAIEGLAVYGESRFSKDGRLNHAPYRLMLDAARRDNLFPEWSRIDGLPAAWPGPASKYLFGAGFMEFLAETYGADRLRLYLDQVAGRLVLLSSGRDFKKTFGEPLGKLWHEYEKSVPSARRPAPEPITQEGFYNRYPCALGENSLAYYHRDFRGRGTVETIDLPSGRNKVLFGMDAVNSLDFAKKEGKLYLSASDLFHSFSDFSDLYEFDLKQGRLKRLSRGGRLSHPVRHENSGWLYCVQRRNNRCRLALFSAKTGEAKSISMAFAGMSQLSLSPDGSRLAAAAKPVGGPWGIAVFLESGVLDRFLTAAGSDLSQPRWQDDEKVLFVVSGKETSSLASYALDANSGWRLEDPQLAGPRQFDLSSDGREIFYTYFSGRGEEIARGTTAETPLSPMEITVASGISESSTAAAVTTPNRSRAYRPLRDLLPHWWSPALRAGGDEVQAGIMTGGVDALGIHSFSLEGYYGLSSRRPNLLFSYAYDGLFPTLSLAYSDSVDYYRGSQNSLRTRELKLASLWPLRLRKRSQLHAYADLHLEERSYIEEWGVFDVSGSANGFRLGLGFNSAREYYDSVSPADGVRLALQGFIHPEGLGNDRANRGIQADLRGYVSLFRPGVLAWRLAAARSWDAGIQFYEMGGIAAESGLGNSHPFRLLRGFDTGHFRGDRGWQFNLEYRQPLFKIEKSVVPAFSLDRVYLSAFFDMGRAFFRYREYVQPVAYSLGGEAVLRLAFGGSVATDLALGAAYGFGPEKQTWIYLRTGRSF
jgi:hypothetical protein